MKEDRDYLVKFTFPQLRKLCESRGVTWGEVDLRWGVTDEQAAEGNLLPICLEEIHRCRPYFIGLLGERYGWVPDTIPPELLEREAWLKDYLHDGKSVTEMEIFHGVLRDPEMAEHAFFYFRDPAYARSQPPKRRDEYLAESPEDETKLADLKQHIRECRLPVHEGYADPEALGGLVLKDLTAVIERLYPEDTQPDPLDREAADHDAFARGRARVHVGRSEYFDRLDAHVASQDAPLVVLGESGIGKSALVANWYLRHRKRHPHEFALIHFIGGTQDSADAIRLMRRIMQEFKRHFDLPDELPVHPDRIREEFGGWLEKVAGAGLIVLVLDGLNQLEDRDAAPDLGWLPVVLPPNCRVILSTLPGRSLEAIRRREWPMITVEPLTVPERQELVTQFLAQYSRRLSPARVERIISAEQTANPLFLRTMLDELRQFGEHDRLGERIEYYLGAGDPGELHERILDRWEEDYGRNLVRRSLVLIWASRRGLSETEVLDLLGDENGPLPRAVWTPFHLAAEGGFAHRSGLLTFSHNYLREAVRRGYVSTPEEQRAVHRQLGVYFERQGQLTERDLDDLPLQWQRAEEWERLRDLLAQKEVFLWFYSEERRRVELNLYWLDLGFHFDPVVVYQEAVARWEGEPGAEENLSIALGHLGIFHKDRTEYHAAELLLRRALAIDEAAFGPEDPKVSRDLEYLGSLLFVIGRLKEAESLQRRALAIAKASYGPEHPRVVLSLSNLAILLHATNRLEEAESLLRRALAIEEATFGSEHPRVAGVLHNLAHLLQETSCPEEAESLYRRALHIDETSYGPEYPGVARDLNYLAWLLKTTNRLEEAEPLMRRALVIAKASYGPEHPEVANSLGNLGTLLHAAGRLEEAEPLLRRSLVITEASFGQSHPGVAVALNNLGTLLHTAGRLEEAEPLLRRSLVIAEANHGPEHPQVAKELSNMAALLHATNRLKEAEPLLRRALAIDEASYVPTHPDVAICLNNLAVLLQDTNRLKEAEPLMRRSLAILFNFLRATGHEHPRHQSTVHSYAAILRQMGQSPDQIQTRLDNLRREFGVYFGRK
jgi:tetratricopeptide (TPR) repeat protein